MRFARAIGNSSLSRGIVDNGFDPQLQFSLSSSVELFENCRVIGVKLDIRTCTIGIPLEGHVGIRRNAKQLTQLQ